MLIKRIFDLVCSILGLIILSPLLFIIAITIKCTTSGPVLFCQNRVGRNGTIFSIYKFRTMKNESMGSILTIGRDERITGFGHILRKVKLDELPQLINVILGDMSLVGPRPEVPKYVDLYPVEVRKVVLSVRPGITDWASIVMIDESRLLGQSANPEYKYINQILPKKLELAVKYVKTRTFVQDLLIILYTIKKICRK